MEAIAGKLSEDAQKKIVQDYYAWMQQMREAGTPPNAQKQREFYEQAISTAEAESTPPVPPAPSPPKALSPEEAEPYVEGSKSRKAAAEAEAAATESGHSDKEKERIQHAIDGNGNLITRDSGNPPSDDELSDYYKRYYKGKAPFEDWKKGKHSGDGDGDSDGEKSVSDVVNSGSPNTTTHNYNINFGGQTPEQKEQQRHRQLTLEAMIRQKDAARRKAQTSRWADTWGRHLTTPTPEEDWAETAADDKKVTDAYKEGGLESAVQQGRNKAHTIRTLKEARLTDAFGNPLPKKKIINHLDI
jgi:hypothetical protein